MDLAAPTNPYSLLEAKVGRQVVLQVGPKADGEDSREITVVPVASVAAISAFSVAPTETKGNSTVPPFSPPGALA